MAKAGVDVTEKKRNNLVSTEQVKNWQDVSYANNADRRHCKD